MVRSHMAILTPRERQVFDLVIRGGTNKHVARSLGCTERTIKAHRHMVMKKMQVAVNVGAIRNGSFSHEHYSYSHSTTLRAAMGCSVRVASNPGRTKERRIESLRRSTCAAPGKNQENAARLSWRGDRRGRRSLSLLTSPADFAQPPGPFSRQYRIQPERHQRESYSQPSELP